MKNSRLPVMVSIVLAMLVASIDTTIVNTTMPIIAKELGNFELYAWTFASYMIFSTVISPIAGRISDIFGRKKIFGAGILLFMAGSLLCGFADSMMQLVLFRAVQGIGAGVMMPFPIIIAGDLFPVEKRGKIQAFFTAMWGISALIAPSLGAFFVEYASWRWIFYVNVPIGILSIILLFFYKEEYRSKPASVDYAGALLFAAGISLLLATTVVKENMMLYAAAGAVVIVLFSLYERRHPSPIVPFSLFGNPSIRWMIINSFIACAALFGTGSYIPLFLQNEGFSLFASGLALLGTSCGWMVVAVPAGKWMLKMGHTPLILIGNFILVASGTFLLFLNPGTGFAYVFIAMVVQGLAFGLIFTVSIIASQQLVEPHQKGVSTSLQLFSRNIGSTIGVTVMGGILVRSGSQMNGIHNLFVYGFSLSFIALLTAFFLFRTNPLPYRAWSNAMDKIE